MILKRKLYVSPEYYGGLTEAEKQSLFDARKKLARYYYRKRKDHIPGVTGDRSYAKLRESLVDDLAKQEKLHRAEDTWGDIDSRVRKEKRKIKETDRSFETRARRFKEAINRIAEEKKREEDKKAAERAALDLRNKRKDLVSKLKKKKAIKGALIVGGAALGIGLGAKAIKDAKENKKQRLAKEIILKSN